MPGKTIRGSHQKLSTDLKFQTIKLEERPLVSTFSMSINLEKFFFNKNVPKFASKHLIGYQNILQGGSFWCI